MRADPACRFPEHRSTDWALEHDLTWQCGICQAPSRAVVKVGMAVYRDNDIGATVPGEGLSPAEADRLGELEQVVARGLRTFVEVGNALAEIRDQRLYRVGHRTFEDYCRERWDLSRPYAYNLIDAAAVSAIADTAGLPVPASEAVARALVPLKRDPARVRAAWADTVAEHGPTPTARQVRARVKGATRLAVRDATTRRSWHASSHWPKSWPSDCTSWRLAISPKNSATSWLVRSTRCCSSPTGSAMPERRA